MGGNVVDESRPLDGDAMAPFQVPAHEVLGEFRAKVQQTVRPEDVQTHYDLGIAYKEMGLLEEALAEFETALRHGGGTRAADCVTMMGQCEIERGNVDAAIGRFKNGLALKGLTPEAKRALSFELGAAYESSGKTAEALAQYEAVHGEDAKYRDVVERIKRLGGNPVAKPKQVAAAASRPPVQPQRSTPAPAAVQKAAAQARPAAAAVAPQAPAAASDKPEPSPEPPRKNRKIGFV
jgi:tetratricopeptide (TPR) repeat protein